MRMFRSLGGYKVVGALEAKSTSSFHHQQILPHKGGEPACLLPYNLDAMLDHATISMALLHAHLEQISLCAASVAELSYVCNCMILRHY